MRFIAYFARLISLTQRLSLKKLSPESFSLAWRTIFFLFSQYERARLLHVYKITTVSLTFLVMLFSLTQQYHDVYLLDDSQSEFRLVNDIQCSCTLYMLFFTSLQSIIFGSSADLRWQFHIMTMCINDTQMHLI